jgi:ADP-heptose:LPS heptosyltransferase
MAPLLEGNPDVDRVLTFDRRSIVSQAALYARLARGGYSAVLDLVSNPRSAFLAALTRAPVRAGFDIPGRAWAYTVRVPREPLGAGGKPRLRYAPEAALDVVRALGHEPRGTELTFAVGDAASRAIDRWLDSIGPALAGRRIVGCLPTGSWPAKTWYPERFAAVLDELAEEAAPVWIWGPGELEEVEAARASMTKPSFLAPPTGWQELGALLRRSALFIGNDSGPKHVAAALGTPTVTIFGPTHPATWHPPRGPHAIVLAAGLECLHCNANVCPLEGADRMRCMTDVSVASVVSAARGLLRDRREATCANP